MNVSDLLSSPPDYGSKKRPRADTAQGLQGPEISVPTLSSLTAQFPERNTLYAHLATLPKPILISVLLEQAKDMLPASKTTLSSNLAHCVYCHKLFDKDAEVDGCRLEHFGDLEEEDTGHHDTKMYWCCGLIVDGYANYYEGGCHPPPEDGASPYCWEGRHHDKLIEEGDKYLVMERWWKRWEDSGEMCVDLGCHNKPNGGHLEKRPRAG